MATYTVTIDVAEFVANGAAPRLAFVTFARAVVDESTGEIVTTSPVSVRVTQTPTTQVLQSGVIYKVRGDGISGVGTFYASATADLTLGAMRDSHQVDPSSAAPLPTYPTVASQITALQASVAAILQGAPGAYDTFLEVATQFGLDEATVTALQALVAGKAPLASPAFTGTPTIAGTAVAKTTDISTAIANLVNGASTALDTLSEIDAQIAADEGSAAALASVVATKQTAAQVASLIAAQAASDAATYSTLANARRQALIFANA